MSPGDVTTAASLTPEDLPYLKYLNLGWAIISLLCQLTTILTMSFLLYCSWSKSNRLKASSFSNAMLIYLIYHIFFCIICIPSHVPVFMKLIPATSKIIIEQQLNYYIFLIPIGIYYYHSVFPVFFLILDRCFGLIYPFYYNKRAQKYFIYVAIFTIVFTGFGYLMALIFTPQLDEAKAKCSPIECFLINYRSLIQNNLKLAIGITNIICTCYFLKVLRLGNNKSLKNRIVKVTLCMEILLNVSVSILTTIFLKLVGRIPITYLGLYPLVPITLDTAICSLYYLKVLLNRNKKLSVPLRQNA